MGVSRRPGGTTSAPRTSPASRPRPLPRRPPPSALVGLRLGPGDGAWFPRWRRRHMQAVERRKGPNGIGAHTARRVRPAHRRGARDPLRPPLVRRRARAAQEHRDPGLGARAGARGGRRPRRVGDREPRAPVGAGRRSRTPTRRRSRSCRGARAAAVARMFCDIRLPDGTPFPGDCRDALRRQLDRAAELGYSFQVGPEIEFFLFDEPDGDAGAEPRPLDEGSYFDLTAAGRGLRLPPAHDRDHGADGHPGEGLAPRGRGLAARDRPEAHRRALDGGRDRRRSASPSRRWRASSASTRRSCRSRSTGSPARGCTSTSRCSTSRPSATSSTPRRRRRPLSETGSHFLAGVLAHAPELTAVTNQWVNSYKRLATGFEAPQAICWTRQANGALVRVPSNRPGKESAARIELRSPDPACNPYLAFALVLAAGLRRDRAAGTSSRPRPTRRRPARLPAPAGGPRRGDRPLRGARSSRRTSSASGSASGSSRTSGRSGASYRATVTEVERTRYLRLL